ncbi:nitrogen utilization protein B [Francisella tularensis subsp. holarctica PHIT-FT049]|uniref:transcription antitermination factor NusB n=1 Tax=Francisella tularensis TaxID=263 RepID=UPI00015D79A5|nr:transcription antitermination factor NusB [Francisella tularensis]AHH46137.1 nitrogen utilization protein B [Francisella tularensis subsp. holarctica PHIT-FT049]ALK94742.1 nitrogen utilization protein B [Francisella tularensis]EDO65953.1 N utilisation substance protein B [Francisella tularensis subsp. holarctica FSC022]KIP30278.1 transcription antitermination factor NusB [Francisella tularensis subsp. holarctica]MCC9171468.1 transcription antitermination factor NusB [Francisella tularensis]
MKTTARARNNARLYAVQALYQKKIADNTFSELKIQYYADNADRHYTDWDLFYRLIDAVKTNQDTIDKYIKENSSNGVESINYVDYAVLQVAIAELIECLENPYQVIIKEYVEICYSMGTEEGYKFINAVLQNLAKSIRSEE